MKEAIFIQAARKQGLQIIVALACTMAVSPALAEEPVLAGMLDPGGNLYLQFEAEPNTVYAVQRTEKLGVPTIWVDWRMISNGATPRTIIVTDTNLFGSFGDAFFRVGTGGRYSSNCLGALRRTMARGTNLISNPFRSFDSRIGALLPNCPDTSWLLKINPRSPAVEAAWFEGGEWDNPDVTLNPGEGAMLVNPGTAFTVVFFGEVASGRLEIPLGPGNTLCGSAAPLRELWQFPAVEGDEILTLDPPSQVFFTNRFSGGHWDKPLHLAPAQAFWLLTTASRVWTQEYTTGGPTLPMHPPWITEEPASQTLNAGATAVFKPVLRGGEPMGFLWLKDGHPLHNGGNVTGANSPTLEVANVIKADEGTYQFVATNVSGVITSSVALLTVIEPNFLTHPQSLTVWTGSNAVLSCAAAGTHPMDYSWEKDGVRLPNATNAALTLDSVQPHQAGIYRVVVSNLHGVVVSSNATLTVNIDLGSALDAENLTWATGDEAPWNGQCRSGKEDLDSARSASVGRLQSSWLSTEVLGPGTLNFWWRHSPDGSAVLEFAINDGDAWSEAVYAPTAWQQVTRTLGPGRHTLRWSFAKSFWAPNTDSGRGEVDLVDWQPTPGEAPRIITSPTNHSVPEGSLLSLVVRAEGTEPLQYQWRKDGVELVNSARLADSHSNVLAILEALPEDTGNYDVVIANNQGSITSAVARLTVRAPEAIRLSDYYPLVPGAEFIYAGRDWDGYPAYERKKVVSTNYSLELFTREGAVVSPYRVECVRVDAAYADLNTGEEYDTWVNYMAGQERFGHFGSDDGDESVRVDRGLLLPEHVLIGKSVVAAGDAYLGGEYAGTASIELKVLARSSIQVPAGKFEDVLQIWRKFSHPGGTKERLEWWARGIGPVKYHGWPEPEDDEFFELIQAALPLRLEITVKDGSMVLTLNGKKDASYSLESCAEIESPSWSMIRELTLGSPREAIWTNSLSTAIGAFYRVKHLSDVATPP